MQHMKLKLAAAVAAALLSTNAMADSWAVTQSSTAGFAFSLGSTVGEITQDNSSSSLQAVNAINSNTASVTGSQTTTVSGSNSLRLKQTNGTTSSNQAANYMAAKTIGDASATGETGKFTQTTTGADATLTQESTLASGATGDTGNTQGLNVANATAATAADAKIDYLEQDANGVKAATLSQSGTSKDTQGLNIATSTGTINKVTQKASTTSAMGLTQSAGSKHTQAANMVNSTGTITSATQTANPTAATLQQTSTGGSTNLQAINTVETTGTAAAVTTVGQTASPSGAMSLTQSNGSSSTQAANRVKATGNVGSATQTAKPTSVSLTQSSSGTNNLQAINTLDAASATSVTQEAATTTTGDTVLTQSGSAGTGNVQAANRTAITGAVATTLGQTAGKVGQASKLYQSGGGGKQALNMAEVGSAAAVNQTAYGVATLDQGYTANFASAVASTQAGNALKATTGDVKATQKFNFDNTNGIDLKQRRAVAGSVQAGNLIDVTASSTSLSDGKQYLGNTDNATTALALSQTGTSTKAIQAGNAVISSGSNGSSNTLTQTAYANQLAMTQSESSNSYQAVNYVGVAPQ